MHFIKKLILILLPCKYVHDLHKSHEQEKHSSKPWYLYKSFTIVEIMIVLSILAVIVAIAIPNYRTHLIKARIAAALPVLTEAMDAAIKYSDSVGSFPPSSFPVFDINPATVGIYYTMNIPPVVGFMPGWDGGSHFWVCIHLADVGIPGYVAPTDNNGTHNKLCMGAYLTSDNIYIKSCGSWGNENQDIPVQYLPNNCNCNWVQNILNNSPACYCTNNGASCSTTSSQ